ncbi:efflux RND transporter periplasmic adaptor subunit [Methylobacter sp. BBA5.1]|jgi:hypothetical protein|uniref:efflux RND transporter periplasmic adaptor subunit n=1 Tax=Methylobacter sp. BBA5.1 TaxID=1495064 RepID=UPI000A94B977|nr:hypothetical protein [Methylobacter sp. BBA5.1]
MLFFAKITAFLIACFFSAAIFPVSAEHGDTQEQTETGRQAVVLDDEARILADLQIQRLVASNYQPEFTAYGKAVAIQPLLALRSQYRTALAEHKSAAARFNLAEQGIKRQQDLYHHDIASKRSLQNQQSQWQTDKAQLDAARFRIKAIYDEALLSWGGALTDWALSPDSDKLAPFLSGRQILLQVTLPANSYLADDVKEIYIEPAGVRGRARKATRISAAPQSDGVVQGESYFFQADGDRIRPGMRVAAWIARQAEDRVGVMIPKSALIWHLGQAFVYIKTGNDRFSRRPVTHFSAAADGYFVSAGIDPGEELVTIGAQMLLSEEMRGQIPDEDDD